MKVLIKNKYLLIVLGLLLAFLNSCSEEIRNPKEKILVNIDNKITISLNEFIRRAEYTVRPKYCKQNTYLHKKIILNSLIAEKLFALEVADNDKIVNNANFQGYLKGRREQAMRQYMYLTEATKKVSLDTSVTKNYYKKANREYEVEYFSVTKKQLRDNNLIDVKITKEKFANLFKTLFKDEKVIPTRKVLFSANEHKKITEALFANEVNKDEVLSPVKIGENNFVIIRIKSWTDTKSITPNQITQRYKKVTETLTYYSASDIWNKKIKEIMSGKKLTFYPEVAKKVKEIYKDTFFKTDEQKKEMLKSKFHDQEIKVKEVLDKTLRNDLLNQPFFNIDGVDWTVKDFKQELISHPLVFRNRRIPSGQFAKEFKYAIVDLIEDHFVTKTAYEKGYDKVNVIKRNEQMWKDSFLSTFAKNMYLEKKLKEESFNKKNVNTIEEFLNSYVKELQKKYSKKVELDFEEFEKIKLTSIDLFVKQPTQPYKLVVPMFPTLTTENYLGYIKEMSNNN